MTNIKYNLTALVIAGATALSGCNGCNQPEIGHDGVTYIDPKAGFYVQKVGTDETNATIIRPFRADGRSPTAVYLPLFNGRLDTNHSDGKKGKIREPHVHYSESDRVTIKLDFDNERGEMLNDE